MVETRRSSSSAKRSLSSPPPSNAKRSKVSEDASSTSLPSAEIFGQVNESGNESREPELRPSDLPDADSLKAVDLSDARLPEKSPAVAVEGEALVSPRSSDETVVEAEKSKSAGVAAHGRSKKRPAKSTKSSAKAAWGKLLSQCSQEYFRRTDARGKQAQDVFS